MTMIKPTTIDEYLTTVPENIREILEKLQLFKFSALRNAKIRTKGLIWKR
jgi:hypothetical protein